MATETEMTKFAITMNALRAGKFSPLSKLCLFESDELHYYFYNNNDYDNKRYKIHLEKEAHANLLQPPDLSSLLITIWHRPLI